MGNGRLGCPTDWADERPEVAVSCLSGTATVDHGRPLGLVPGHCLPNVNVARFDAIKKTAHFDHDIHFRLSS
jgi:hypothetical protein